MRADVIKLLVQSNASSSQKRQLLLEKGLSRSVTDQLEILLEGGKSHIHRHICSKSKFTLLSGTDTDTVCARLEKVSPHFASAISEAVREVTMAMQFAAASRVQRPIAFKPLFMLRNPHAMFDGLCFEVVRGLSASQKRSDVLAVGGR